MKARNKSLAGLALGAVLVSSGAMAAALNGNQVHLALTELKLALVKMAVANAMLSDPKPPSSNAEVHVAPANQLGGQEIDSILVSTGGVINVYLAPSVGVSGGIIQLVPRIVATKAGKKGVQYTCYSPNIPDIANAAPECTYHPVAK